MTTVRVPATTANLGAGFDTLGLALTRALILDLDAADADAVADSHPASRAFHTAGGEGRIAVHHDFPAGRGMGFSGAARVAGVVAAAVQRGDDWSARRAELLALAAAFEGHSDNAAASMYGGLTVTAGEHCVRVPSPLQPSVILWIPDRETSTKQSRTMLPDEVAFADAVFNIGRSALFVAAWATGDLDVLRAATEDRMHQDRRLAAVPDSAAALAAAVAAGAHGAWLSGSGPTIAALAADAPTRAAVVSALERLPSGRVDECAIDQEGTTVR
jgi:homoserine kinase